MPNISEFWYNKPSTDIDFEILHLALNSFIFFFFLRYWK